MKNDKYLKKFIQAIKFTCLILCLFAFLFLVGCDLNNNSKNKEHVDKLFNEIKETIDLDSLTSDIYIPDSHRGATITVESSDTSIIDVDGTVNRQEEDELVILFLNIEYEGVSYSKELTIVVKGTGPTIIDSSKQDEDYVNSIYNELVGSIDVDNVIENLTLGGVYKDVSVQFQSSNASVIDANGVVNRQVEDELVILTFDLQYNDKVYNKELTVVVKGTGIINSGDVTKEDLEQILSKIVLDEGYLLLEDSINLPSTIDNYPIVWTVDNNSVKLQGNSSQKQLIANDALEDTNYVLTAAISYGSITGSRTFNGVVKAITIEKKLINIKNDLNDILALENKTINEDISFKYTSLYGSTIIWESSDTDLISSDGFVNKNLTAETSVTIHYTIILDNVEYEGQFKVTVAAKTVYSSYYSAVDGKIGNALFIQLRTIITSTHKKITTYDDCKTPSIVEKTDGDPNNPGNIILFWSGLSIKSTWDGGTSWNREHIWPQSKGWFSTSGAGGDLHHIRPTDPSTNNSHGNYPYAIITGGNYVKTSSKNGSILTNCKTGGSKFEPCDERKGDVARIIFYLLVRYPESDSYSITNVASSMDILLQWHKNDPVDQSEIRRNEAVYSIQGNRNPFIDYEEFADMIW